MNVDCKWVKNKKRRTREQNKGR